MFNNHDSTMVHASSSALILCAALFFAEGESVEDTHPKCKEWGGNGECTANEEWMNRNCRATCSRIAERCFFWAESGECDKNPTFMLRSCAEECHELRTREEAGAGAHVQDGKGERGVYWVTSGNDACACPLRDFQLELYSLFIEL